MIKSKHNTLGFWTLTIICTIAFLWFIGGLSKSLFGIGFNFRAGENLNELHRDLILFFGIAILWCLVLSAQVKNITIDLTDKTISFQNIFTRKSKLYLFSDFDGYIDTTIPHNNFYSDKAIGLIKNKRVIRRIESYYCSNFDELRNGLSEMKNLGSVKFTFFRRIKMFLKFPVL